MIPEYVEDNQHVYYMDTEERYNTSNYDKRRYYPLSIRKKKKNGLMKDKICGKVTRKLAVRSETYAV